MRVHSAPLPSEQVALQLGLHVLHAAQWLAAMLRESHPGNILPAKNNPKNENVCNLLTCPGSNCGALQGCRIEEGFLYFITSQAEMSQLAVLMVWCFLLGGETEWLQHVTESTRQVQAAGRSISRISYSKIAQSASSSNTADPALGSESPVPRSDSG